MHAARFNAKRSLVLIHLLQQSMYPPDKVCTAPGWGRQSSVSGQHPLPLVLGVLALCVLCAISAAINLMCSGLQTSCPVILSLTEKRAHGSKASKHQYIFSLFFSPSLPPFLPSSIFLSSEQNNRETKRKFWLISSYKDVKGHRWRKRSLSLQ